MPTTNQTVKSWRGNSKTLHVDLIAADGSDYDPSQQGIEIEWRLMTSHHGLTLVQKTLSEGEITVNVQGGIDIVLLPADTDYPQGLYYHECRVFDVADPTDVYTALTGVFIIYPSARMGPMENPAAAQLVLNSTEPSVT